MAYSNKRTAQPSLSGQSIKFFMATRVFVAAANTAEPTAQRLEDTTPSGWTDLGAINKSSVMLDYNKTFQEVLSGMDQIYRGGFTTKKGVVATFSLDNFDLTVLALITGQTATNISVSSSVVGGKLFIGKEDIVNKAILFVASNKLDNKEHRIYNPNADLVFNFVKDNDDATLIQVNANLRAFTPTDDSSNLESLFSHGIYAAP